MHHILIIEDDSALAQGLCRALTSDQTTAKYVSTIKEAREELAKNAYTLIILDVNLPDGNGFDLLRELEAESDIAVILLTANDMETDIVAGLESGAEDYITKPFSLAVLRARVNAQLRRLEQKTDQRTVICKEEIGDWTFDFERMEFYYRGEPIELSKTEQKLLRILTANKETTLPRTALIDYIWGQSEWVDENALSVCVKRLRDKLHAGDYIKTVYGLGYVWRDPDE